MGNTDASTWVMLPPAVARLGSWPVSETTWVDDFFMATPVAVCGDSAPLFMAKDSCRGRSFRARYCRAWRRLVLTVAAPRACGGGGGGAGTLAVMPARAGIQYPVNQR